MLVPLREVLVSFPGALVAAAVRAPAHPSPECPPKDLYHAHPVKDARLALLLMAPRGDAHRA